MDFLQDLLDVIEELDRTTVSLGSRGGSGVELAGFALKGASPGFNKDSQFNVFEQDGDLVFFRNVQGVINIVITSGGSGIIDAEVPGYSGVMTFGDGDGITIVIRQD